MKIAYLGAGAWGFTLARLLASKGFEIVSWTIEEELLKTLQKTKEHPFLKGRPIEGNVTFTSNIEEALTGAQMVVESVTAEGVRPTFELVKKVGLSKQVPIVLTSKGIEQNSDLILSDVVLSIMGLSFRSQISSLSGPSFAEEVSQKLPTAIVASGYSTTTVHKVVEAFTTPYFRIYPCHDVKGVAFGGSLKNIIAIACGISDGMHLGNGAKASLMTRGLHEIVKIAKVCGCKPQTLYGLSGMGDLFLTCSSPMSRNYRFGKLLSEGVDPAEAKKQIGMVVEGAYSAITAIQLSNKHGIPMPISQAVVDILERKIKPQEAVGLLMQRAIKEESL